MRWLLLKDLQILRRSPLIVGLLIAYPVALGLLIGFALSTDNSKPRVAFLNEVDPEQQFQIGTGEGEIVASATGSWAQYELRDVWRPEDQGLQFLAFPDIKVAVEKRPAIHEATSRLNEQLWLGHFEIWSGSGLVVFRHSTILDAREGDGLSFEQAEAIIEAAVEECERFYPVFQFVLWGGKSPGEAIAAALIETHGEA